MSEKLIAEVAKVLEEWNPLGERANSVEGLDGYRIEAMDIIGSTKILSAEKKIKETIETVLSQAFHIELEEEKLAEATKRIELLYKTIK